MQALARAALIESVEAVEKLPRRSQNETFFRVEIDFLKSTALSCPKIEPEMGSFRAPAVFLQPR
jgi:hypothetical protein